jgi:hypothetical protein
MRKASPHCSVKNGKVGKGAAHASYIAGDGRYADRDDVVSVADRNLPDWAADGVDFFAAADQYERANGRAYSEIEAAIPRGVADPAKYAQEFVERLLGANHPYRVAVHDKTAADGGRNTHMHLMFSDRKLDGIERSREQFFKRAASRYRDARTGEMREADPAKGGAAKDRKWNDRNQVQVVRDMWEEFGKARGFNLDLRSNAAKGLGAAEPKLGPAHARSSSNPAREARRATMEQLRETRRGRAEVALIEKSDRLAAAHRKKIAWRKTLAERRSEWRRCSVVAPKEPPFPGKPKVYRWDKRAGAAAGMAAVIDYGDRLRPAGDPAKISDAKIRAMLDVAAQKGWKEISVTGDEAFRRRVCDAAIARGIGMLDADLKAYAAVRLKAKAQQRPEPAAPAPARPRPAEAPKRPVEPPKPEIGERYVRALANVTSETLATVPGLLPPQAVRQALAEVRKELEAEKGQAQPVDVDAVRRQVRAKPEQQRRLVQAAKMEEKAKATLEDIAGMGMAKRLWFDTKGMTAEAAKMMENAKLERTQVSNAVEVSPEVEAAKQANLVIERRRPFIKVELEDLEKAAQDIERGQALYQLPKNGYRVPDAVMRVVERARTTAPNSLAGMRAEEVERMTTKAIDVEWKKPESQHEFKVRASRFVLPAEQRKQLQEREAKKALERNSGKGLGD